MRKPDLDCRAAHIWNTVLEHGPIIIKCSNYKEQSRLKFQLHHWRRCVIDYFGLEGAIAETMKIPQLQHFIVRSTAPCSITIEYANSTEEQSGLTITSVKTGERINVENLSI